MQALLHDFAAKQPGKQSHAAEEDSETKVKELEDAGKNGSIFSQVAMASHRAVQTVQGDDEGRRERREVDPNAAPHPQNLLEFDAGNREDLRRPQLPRR